MSFRRGTRRDNSRYSYPVDSKKDFYDGVPLYVKSIVSDDKTKEVAICPLCGEVGFVLYDKDPKTGKYSNLVGMECPIHGDVDIPHGTFFYRGVPFTPDSGESAMMLMQDYAKDPDVGLTDEEWDKYLPMILTGKAKEVFMLNKETEYMQKDRNLNRYQDKMSNQILRNEIYNGIIMYIAENEGKDKKPIKMDYNVTERGMKLYEIAEKIKQDTDKFKDSIISAEDIVEISKITGHNIEDIKRALGD